MIQQKQVINLYENKNQVLNAAIDKIVVEIFNKQKKDDKTQSIVLTGCSPLAGTTSTCIGLGIAVATTGRRTLIIDCDVRKAIKYKKLNEKTTLGLADYLLQENTKETLDVEHVLYNTNIDDLFYIPCGGYSEYSTRILCSSRMEQLIEKVKEQFDCILFDFPSIAVVPDAQILFQSVEGIVLLSALGETRKKQIQEAKLKVAPYAEKYYGMIINKIQRDMYRQNVREYDYYFVNKKGEQKLNGNIPYKKYKKYQKRAKSTGGKN